LTLGVLRRKLYLDRIVQSFSKSKIDKFDLEILLALRIGLFQIIFLDKIPDFSAINESVNLTHLAKKRSATGLVNAVLRRAARERNLNLNLRTKLSAFQSKPRIRVGLSNIGAVRSVLPKRKIWRAQITKRRF
jgi:16S rRNA (cytosine967-C5)-methyltransferase